MVSNSHPPTLVFNDPPVDPVYNPEDAMASMQNVTFPASKDYPAGTVLGAVTATPGEFGAYASGHTDGTELPCAITRYHVVTDSSGNITNASDVQGALPETTSPVYTQGTFRVSDLTGLDKDGAAKMHAFTFIPSPPAS